VGDTGGCAAIACINGLSGTCGPYNPGGAGVRVTCAQDVHPDGTDAKPACNQGSECHEGQRCVSATLTRNECPPVGCSIDTNHCLGDARLTLADATVSTVSWCTSGGAWTVPEADANVTIPAGTTVTLAGCTTALINKLDIYGTLQFVDGSPSTLRARYIHVAAYTGRLEAGTFESPFTSEARIQLYGHRTTPNYPNSGLGSKVRRLPPRLRPLDRSSLRVRAMRFQISHSQFMAVFGELSLVGAPKPPARPWSQLAYTAEVGTDVIVVPAAWASAIGLSTGDELIVGASNLTWDESEVVVVRNASASGIIPDAWDVILEAPLLYDHTGAGNATWLGRHSVPMLAAEVSLLRAGDARVNNVSLHHQVLEVERTKSTQAY
jgi:hypothetical protein